MDRPWSRRRLLGGSVTAGVALLAGCVDDGTGSDGGSADGANEATDDDTETESGGSSGTDGDTAGDSDEDTEEDGGDGTGDNTGDDGGDGSASTDPAELDLREANVVDVALDASGDAVAFDVTVHHDDDGEDGYANWWQVERLDGEQLGRRELLHAHSRQPFTRSETIDVPDDVDCVVVRGHDQTHEYGGLAALVEVGSGAIRLVDQGSDPRSFEQRDCPSATNG